MLPSSFRPPCINQYGGGLNNVNDLMTIRDRLPLARLRRLELYNYGSCPRSFILTLSAILRQQSSSLRLIDLFAFDNGFNLQPLAAMVHLTNLSLSFCDLDDTACDYVARYCTQLRHLALVGNWRITSDGFMSLARTMSELVELHLGSTNTNANDVQVILRTTLVTNEPATCALANLRFLYLPGTHGYMLRIRTIQIHFVETVMVL